MVRGKIELKRIENETSRQVTFSKRRNGLLKKAYELSVLCESEVAVIVFSQKGRLYEFASSNMRNTIDRYEKYTKNEPTMRLDIELYLQKLMHERAIMIKKIELLEFYQRKLLGQELDSCSVEQLRQLGSQLEESLFSIRSRKAQLFKENLEQLKAKLYVSNLLTEIQEQLLLEENGRLSEQFGAKQWKPSSQQNGIGRNQRMNASEVVTDLFIGLPSS